MKTGKAFQRQEILLKYELRVELFGEAECISLCTLVSQAVPEKIVTWLRILKLAVGLFKALMKNKISEISY